MGGLKQADCARVIQETGCTGPQIIPPVNAMLQVSVAKGPLYKDFPCFG